LRDVSFFLRVAPEIIEDTDKVAIKIGGYLFALYAALKRRFSTVFQA